MDPAAATTDTATALRSALDAAYRERQALSDRLDEVDQLIHDLHQAAESGAESSGRKRRTGQAATRTRSTKKTSKKSAAKRATAKRSGAKKTAAKKASAKKAGAKKTAAKKASRSSASKATTKRASKQAPRKATGARGASGTQDVGRTDRVVQLIAQANNPLTTGEVRSRLLQYEPGVTSKLVSASLSYAQRKGRIHKSSDGRWVPARGATSQSASGTDSRTASSAGAQSTG